LTGASSVWYVQQAQETDALAEVHNEMGGLNIQGKNYIVKIKREDAKSTTDGAAQAAAKLAADPDMHYILNSWGYQSGAGAAILAKNKIINWNGYPTGTASEMKDHWQFASHNGQIGFGFVESNALKKYWPEAKTVVNILNDTGTLELVSKFLFPYQKSLGLEPMGPIIGLDASVEDLTTLADKVNQMKPDGICLLDAYVPQAKSFIKELRLIGNNVPFCYAAVTGAAEYLELLGPTADNCWFSGLIANSPNNPPLANKMQAKLPGKSLMMTHSLGLDILLWAMQKADSLDPDVIATYIEESTTHPGFEDTSSGVVTFGCTEFFNIHDETGKLLKNHGVGLSAPGQRIVQGKIIDTGWLEGGTIP